MMKEIEDYDLKINEIEEEKDHLRGEMTAMKSHLD